MQIRLSPLHLLMLHTPVALWTLHRHVSRYQRAVQAFEDWSVLAQTAPGRCVYCDVLCVCFFQYPYM